MGKCSEGIVLNGRNKDIVKEEVLHLFGIGRKQSLLVFAWVFVCFSN